MNKVYDIIVIGAGSGGLGVSLFAAKIGLKTLLIDKSDEEIGGDCLNDGCVPSKALIHVARILHAAREAQAFGLNLSGNIDIGKVTAYIRNAQDVIRQHENAGWLRAQGMDVALGSASFHSNDEVAINGEIYKGKRIVIATGSRPASLDVPGIGYVVKYNNESVFDLEHLPSRFLVVGGGPIGIEIGQAMRRLGCEVTIVHLERHILPHDNREITDVLKRKLEEEGIVFRLNTHVARFTDKNTAELKTEGGETYRANFDAVFVAIGRTLSLEPLRLEKAQIKVVSGKIVVDRYLRTTNKAVMVCGDVAGSLKFSHAAEQHVRLIANNLFSPIKKKLDNSNMSWVTFSDPQVATFGLSEHELKERKTSYQKVVMGFEDDDRAVVDNYTYGKLVLYISPGSILRSPRLLGGSMIAPSAGELIQELVLAMQQSLSIDYIFNKIYAYPVAARVNQMIIVKLKEKQLTATVKRILRRAFKMFG